jgi:Flp pilus assembly protein TadD
MMRGAGLAPAPVSSPPRDPAPLAAELLRTGVAAQQEGDHGRALDILLRAIDANPDDWIAHTCLGNTLKALGRLDEAIAIHRRALELGGDHRAMSNLALSYRAAGRLDDAIRTLAAAVAREPEIPELHANLAGLLLAADRPVEAEAAARRALALAPGDARAEINLGYARKEQGDFAGALRHLRRAVARDPADADAHWNLGLTLLASPSSRADQIEGWRELEWRHRIPGLHIAERAETRAVPIWTGQSLSGRTLLLQAEQGLGDTLQLVRYARDLRALAGGVRRIILECQPPLERVLRRAAGVDLVVARGGPLPRADLRVGLFSLPMRFIDGERRDGGAERDAPSAAPYLTAEPERVARWRAWLAQRTGAAGFRVGIAWQGNPSYRADRRRSIPLEYFVPTLRAIARAGGAVISLQKGEGGEALAGIPGDLAVIDLGSSLDAEGAFVDTAAVMAGLDLVLTSDTAIPHLAGALGVPVWMALAHLPDWRWGLQGEDCAWYPSMRLFRQRRAGDWTELFARVADALLPQFGRAARGREGEREHEREQEQEQKQKQKQKREGDGA